MPVTFKTDGFRQGLTLLLAGLHNGAHQALVSALAAAKESAARSTLFNDVTGRGRKSIATSVDGEFKGRLFSGVDYMRFVNDGTSPHIIAARSGGMLHFVGADGRDVFRRAVQHPGTKPRPFMGEAADLGEQTLDYGLEVMTEKPIAFFNSGNS